MKGVVRIALSYFGMVPVQRWINGAGLVFLALAASSAFINRDQSAQGSIIFFVLGTILLVLTPAVGGGIALRYASTRSLMHLRPNGRIRLLVATTLTITLLAMLGTLPALVIKWFPHISGSRSSRHVTPLETFEVVWTLIALCWIAMFAISRTMVMFALVGVLPVIAIQVGRFIVPLFPSMVWVLALGIAVWGAFAIWYLRTGYIHRPTFPVMGSNNSTVDSMPLARLAELGAPKGELSPTQAMHYHLLGCASPWFFATTGAWVAALFVVVAVLSRSAAASVPGQLLAMLPFFSFFHASLGFTTARRARFLWLRGGKDRTQLFALAERWGLKSAMTAWVIPGGLTLAISVAVTPGQTLPQLLYVGLQAMAGVVLYYTGTALIRGWTFVDVLLCIGLTLLYMVNAVAFMPVRSIPSSAALAGALAAAAVLALLLRWLAARRWRTLDWRIARPSRAGMGG